MNPSAKANGKTSTNPYKGGTINEMGLTKREYFAAMAMQGLVNSNGLTNPDGTVEYDLLAAWSVAAADALLNELSRQHS